MLSGGILSAFKVKKGLSFSKALFLLAFLLPAVLGLVVMVFGIPGRGR